MGGVNYMCIILLDEIVTHTNGLTSVKIQRTCHRWHGDYRLDNMDSWGHHSASLLVHHTAQCLVYINCRINNITIYDIKYRY